MTTAARLPHASNAGPKRLLLGVIGHVDHGKTALVRALTGIETDRLAEEKRRGISIVLGFAHLSLDAEGSHKIVDLIDMPGHERFVRTMVSGATGLDGVLLVVAANEGVMPQTVEHVDIAGLLGLRRAVIAITKSDLVSADQTRTAARDAAALVRRSGLEAPAPMLISVVTGQGLEALKQVMASVLDQSTRTPDDGFYYLPIDRAFSKAGHGTVVTGTLRRGSLSVEDAVELLPSRRPARLRGLQVHGAPVPTAEPGQRVAVNLRGVEPGQVPRGAALATAGLLLPSAWLTVELRTVAGAPPLATATTLRLLHGTAETEVRLRLLNGDEIAPGGTGFAQLQCLPPVLVPAREDFILRTLSPPGTIAGGRILEPGAIRLRRNSPAVLARLAALAGADPPHAMAQLLEQMGAKGIPLDRLARRVGLGPDRAAALLQQQPVVMSRGRIVLTRESFDAVAARIPRILATSARAHPDGIARDQLRALLPDARPGVIEDAAARLIARGAVRNDGGRLRVPHPQQDQDRARLHAADAARLAETLRQAGLAPPDPGQVAADPQTRKLLDRLVREGTIIRAVDHVQKRELLFHRDAIEAARRRLTPLLSDGPGLLVKEAGAALGISRKYSVPLLEYFDAIRFTRRVADRRVLEPKRS